MPSHLNKYKDLDHFVRVVAAHPVEFEPGKEYLCGINRAILGRLAEVLSGQELYEFLNDSVFKSFGLNNTRSDVLPDDRERLQILSRNPGYDEALSVGGKFNVGTALWTEDFDELF